MLILTTIRPLNSDDRNEFRSFNWDTDIPTEKIKAGKVIFEALSRNNTVLSRKIKFRNTMHPTVMQLRDDALLVSAE